MTMSDEVEIEIGGLSSPMSQAGVSPELDRKRAALDKARQAKADKRTAPERTANVRTAEDARQARPQPAARAEPARDPLPQAELDTFVRRRKRDDRQVGSMDVPDHEKKPGWDYQWVALRVLNQEVDRSTIRDFEHNGGWRPAKARDFPSMVDKGTPDDAPVETMGQRLYMRPLSLTMEAKQEDYDAAREQQIARMKAAANGRGDGGIPDQRGIKRVPVEISIEGVAG